MSYFKNKERKIVAWEGSTVASHIAYKMSEFAAIFPISPSSNIAENVELMLVKGTKNIFGNKLKLTQMQSEAGAIGAVHGAAETGVLSTTFTASQGLLLMIPTLYKLRGGLLPVTLYVATRAVASRSLSIFCDHQDIYACRQTGVAMLGAQSVQEINDLSPVSHAISLEAKWPIINFMDGNRTTHEIQKVELYTDEELKMFYSKKALEDYRLRTLTPTDPVTKGGSEDEFTYFQSLEAQNQVSDNVIKVADKYFKLASKLTGRNYAPFVYSGSKHATDVVVVMGSAAQTVEETVNYLNSHEKAEYGCVKVYLYRPFSVDHLLSVLPSTVKRIAVLDRTKEFGTSGEPLFLDVCAAVRKLKLQTIIGGRYGLSSKNFDPKHVKAIFDNLTSKNPLDRFTVGINDDVTHTSLQIDEKFLIKSSNVSYLIWGLASDGMISASKNLIKIIADKTENFVQCYFTYDSRKAGGATRSYIRFGKNPITSPYYTDDNEFILCSKDNYILTFKQLIKNLKVGGTFLLNTSFTEQEIIDFLPSRFKKQLAEKKAKFYIIDAYSIAKNAGLGNNINTSLQAAFFLLNPSLIDPTVATDSMIAAAKKSYGSKGDAVIQANVQAITSVNESTIKKVNVDPKWADLKVNTPKVDDSNYIAFAKAINNMEGDELPVSTFTKSFNGKTIIDGTMLNDVNFHMQRQLASVVPKWVPENCIQCNQCAFYCPHATIRVFQMSDEEIKNAPSPVTVIDQPVIPGQEPSKYKFSVHIDAENCVGCGLCAEVCPGKDPRDRAKKALIMVDAKTQAFKHRELTEYMYKKVEYKTTGYSIDTLKGAAFLYPYFEASGACAGCGETPYYRLLTQLFGKDMVIANATGCTSIYSGTYPFTPFAKDSSGQGPAWSNSLYENNAEFGFGMRLANDSKIVRIKQIMTEELEKVENPLKLLFVNWLNNPTREKQRAMRQELVSLVEKSKNENVKEILNYKDILVTKSMWIIGGDGWSTDIDFGGLAHVLASGENVNVLVLDTEVYSNTGGQSSSSTPFGASAKFNTEGKRTAKKDLGKIFMSLNNVYVARVSLGMNPAQTIKAMKEAEEYDGPSIVIAYAPCIEHGIKGGLSHHRNREMNAVLSGYWPIYRFDPRRADNNENPLQVDFKKPSFDKIKEYLLGERRFASLFAKDPQESEKILKHIVDDRKFEFNSLLRLSETTTTTV